MNIARHHLIFDLPNELTPESAGVIYDYLRTLTDNFYLLHQDLIKHEELHWKRGKQLNNNPPF